LRLVGEVDVVKLLLEVQRISHLVKEEGEEEVSPTLVESCPPVRFPLHDTLVELVALGHDFTHVSTD